MLPLFTSYVYIKYTTTHPPMLPLFTSYVYIKYTTTHPPMLPCLLVMYISNTLLHTYQCSPCPPAAVVATGGADADPQPYDTCSADPGDRERRRDRPSQAPPPEPLLQQRPAASGGRAPERAAGKRQRRTRRRGAEGREGRGGREMRERRGRMKRGSGQRGRDGG